MNNAHPATAATAAGRRRRARPGRPSRPTMGRLITLATWAQTSGPRALRTAPTSLPGGPAVSSRRTGDEVRIFSPDDAPSTGTVALAGRPGAVNVTGRFPAAAVDLRVTAPDGAAVCVVTTRSTYWSASADIASGRAGHYEVVAAARESGAVSNAWHFDRR